MTEINVVKVDTGDAGPEAVKSMSSAVRTLFGPAAENIGAILEAHTRYYRMKCLFGIQEKFKALEEKHGPIPREAIRTLPIQESMRITDAGSLEADDDVQMLWAQLLRNAQDSRTKTAIEKPYVDLLRSISGGEAILLQSLWNAGEDVPNLNRRIKEEFEARRVPRINYADLEDEFATKHFGRWREIDEAAQRSYAQNLVRLQCVLPVIKPVDLTGMFSQMQVKTPRGTDQLSAIDHRKFVTMVENIVEMIKVSSGLDDNPFDTARAASRERTRLIGGPKRFSAPELQLAFTALGNRLMKACTVSEAL